MPKSILLPVLVTLSLLTLSALTPQSVHAQQSASAPPPAQAQQSAPAPPPALTPPLHAMDAYDTVQHARDRADDLYDKTNPSPEELAKAARILDTALRFLDTPPIRALADGNDYLKYRKFDASRDMAAVYARMGKKDSAFYYLDESFGVGSIGSMSNFLRKDSSFDNIRSDPRFVNLLHTLDLQGDLFKGKAFKTPYNAHLSEVEKVAGLSLLWSQARDNFVYLDHLKEDWNKTYITYLTKVINTANTAEYYHVLESFYAQLHDGHSNVYVPDSLSAEFYSRPPFSTALIEGRVFITDVFSDSLKRTGITPGLEVLQIDGQPVIPYAQTNVAPYLSSSTPQDLEIRTFTYALLCGPKEKPIVLQLKDPKGAITTRSIPRTGYRDIKRAKDIDFQIIGHIGYLTLNAFEDQSMVKKFDSLIFPQLAATKGLVIDIRKNGGGSGGIGFNILSSLTDKPFKISGAKNRKYTSGAGMEIEWQEIEPGTWRANGKNLYAKPVILLVGPRTFSAAEDFTVAFDYMKRGKLMGEPTGGSTGQPFFFNLPGGGTARICSKRDYYPDGKEFVGIGIIPDVIIKPTIQDLYDGKDAVKDRAVGMLEHSN